jgi:phosphoenolpyruvate carboxylase
VSENSFPADDASLRSDVRRLGELLGQTLVRQESQELLDLVERVRKSVREGNGSDIVENLDKKQSIQLVRAFANYFNLANIAEQVHRARVLADQRDEGQSWLSRAVDQNH